MLLDCGEGAAVLDLVRAGLAKAVWVCAADVGEENMTSLVASGIIELIPVTDSEHVTACVV